MRACGGILEARTPSNWFVCRPVVGRGQPVDAEELAAMRVAGDVDRMLLRTCGRPARAASLLPRGSSRSAIARFQFVELVVTPLTSMRGGLRGGADEGPLNRYDRLGWLCQYRDGLPSNSGLRRNGESAGGAAEHRRLPNRQCRWRPSSKFSEAHRMFLERGLVRVPGVLLMSWSSAVMPG